MSEVAFAEIFYYDETSPSFLRWKVDRFNGKYRNVKIINKGDIAGGINKTLGYYFVNIKDRLYRCHRIIWEILYGVIPEGMVIDHINQNPFDNKISNLRCVPRALNQRNMKLSKRNKSGIVGVFRQEKVSCSKSYSYWVVRWSPLDGSNDTGVKQFSVLRYGEENAKQMAEDFRECIIEKLNILGAGYTDLHGKGN
jgi:hypothetical protein